MVTHRVATVRAFGVAVGCPRALRPGSRHVPPKAVTAFAELGDHQPIFISAFSRPLSQTNRLCGFILE
jgi:hypothetical protein